MRSIASDIVSKSSALERDRAMKWEQLKIPDADVRYRAAFLTSPAASEFLRRLMRDVNWRRDVVTVFGRSHPIPRLHQWFGDANAEYRWSGLTMRPEPWIDALARLREHVSEAVGCDFNSLLVNLYRDGRDSMGWHSDDEPELGNRPAIASLSLGAERDFALRYRRRDAGIDNRKIALAHGSLLVMSGSSQSAWQHAVPKSRKPLGLRINLTFRRIVEN